MDATGTVWSGLVRSRLPRCMGRAAAVNHGTQASRFLLSWFGEAGRGGAGRIGEAARRDGARLRAGPQHGSAGRCEPGRTGVGPLRCGKAGRGGGAGEVEERAAFKHRQPRCARVHRPHRAHPSAPPRLSIACPSAPCAAVGPEGAEAVRNSEQDRVLTIEPARPRLGGGPPPGSPPPLPGCEAQSATPERARPSPCRARSSRRRPAARVRLNELVRRPRCTVLL